METAFIHEEGSGRINEDVLHLGRNVFGVFDGATSLDHQACRSGLTGGRRAADTACRVFSEEGDGASLIDMARRANHAILEEMILHGVDLEHRTGLWSTSAAVARMHEDHVEWLQCGDAFVLFLLKDGSYRAPADCRDHDFETLSMWKSVAADSRSTIRQALAGQIRKTRLEMNRTYGVLNGEAAGEDFFQWGRQPLSSISEVLLFTDGLSLPSETPSPCHQFDGLVDAYKARGLSGLKNHIRRLEAGDPECRRYPRFKCHDDIAAIALRPEKTGVCREALPA